MKFCLPRHVHRAGVLTVMVVGGRTTRDDYDAPDTTVYEALDHIKVLCEIRQLRMMVLQGGTPGAPKMARTWAMFNNVNLITEHVNWQKLGAAEGGRLNQAMLDKHRPDICIAMLPGRGATDMVARCRKADIPVFHQVDGEQR